MRIAAVELEGRNPRRASIGIRPTAWDANVQDRDAQTFEAEHKRDLVRVLILGRC